MYLGLCYEYGAAYQQDLLNLLLSPQEPECHPQVSDTGSYCKAGTCIYQFQTGQLQSTAVFPAKHHTAKLQRVQNTAARIVTRSSKHQSITAILKKLHWLPIKERIQFKIITLTWKSLHGQAPAYIDELLTPYVPTRELRSSSQNNLVIPKCNNNYGRRAFATAAPVLWNSLPATFKDTDSYVTFKSKLKTHLFQIAYN